MTGYVKETLAPGENYQYRAHFCWLYDLASWVWLFLSAIPAIIYVYFTRFHNSEADRGITFLMIISVAGLIFGVFHLMTRYFHKWTTVIAVTDMRVVYKTGMISRDSHEIALDKIEEILLHQSFFGRIFNYGRITIRGTGIAKIELPVLAEPIKIRREIETAISAFHERVTRPSDISPSKD